MELAAGFPSTTRDDWRALALGVLAKTGAAFESLETLTYDGVRIAPLYDASDLPAVSPAVRGSRPGGFWDVRQRHAVADPEAVLADLENGVTSLWLVVGDGAITVGELPRVLQDVYLDLAPIVLSAGAATGEAAEALFALAAARGVPLTGNLGATLPFPALTAPASSGSAFLGSVSTGPASSGLPGADGFPSVDVVVGLARRCAADFPGLRAIVVDATPYHDAGGSDVEELGCSIALGVAHLRALTAAGIPVDEAVGQLEFRYAATADQFATIAKLRAARQLWARVLEVCGAQGGQRQHAVTSSAMMTARDPWVNMLRTTLACFAAGVGGADAVTVQPFDACLGLPDGFSRRIARNTQSLLLEEAGVGRVLDPAGGSWYVERLTADLASRAWAWFQELEASGDPEALIAERIAATRERRAGDIAHRRFPITGVSEFPNLHEKSPRRGVVNADKGDMSGATAPDISGSREAADPRAPEGPPAPDASGSPVVDSRGAESPPVSNASGSLGVARAVGSDALRLPAAADPPVSGVSGSLMPEASRASGLARGVGFEGLPVVRYAEGFEGLRDLADAQAERPVVFLATIGPVAVHTARASFAANLFQAGGLETVTAGPSTDPDQIAATFAASGSTVACLCSSDRLYGEHAVAVAAALRRAGVRRVWLAGKGDYEGVDAQLFAGCDALAVLRTTFDDLGVTR